MYGLHQECPVPDKIARDEPYVTVKVNNYFLVMPSTY